MIEWLTGAVRFVLLETIWGAFAAAAIASMVASMFAAVFRLKKSGPTLIAACTILAGLGHLLYFSGEDRYRFERETLAQLEEAPWAKVVKTTKWADIAAPRTWFDAPVGHFVVAQPAWRWAGATTRLAFA